MAFHRTENPQAVDVKPVIRLNGHSCIFCWDIFDKAFSTLLTAVKNKPLIEALLQPFLFGKALFARHGTTDVFFVDIFFRNIDVVHRLFPFPNAYFVSNTLFFYVQLTFYSS